MSTITPNKVKELRERTGVGMGKCKEALEQSNGDIELAIEHLRKAGMASAVKKEGRETKEGCIGIGESAAAIALVEVNTETDFVAQNESFKEFVASAAKDAAASKPSSLEAFLSTKSSHDSTITIDEYRSLVIQRLGENIQVKRLEVLSKDSNSSYGLYSHMGGKIVTLVVIEGSNSETDLAKEIAMHVAADSPDYLKPEEVPADVVEKEREIAKSQIQGKPANIVDKIVEGKVNAFYDQVCLLRQKFVKDPSVSIEQLVQNKAKSANKTLSLKSFIRWKVGE